MSVNAERITNSKKQLKAIIEKLNNVPEKQKEKAKKSIEMCRECLKDAPATDTPVYIHITGTDKSFKTSYLLDLFDNDELRKIFSVTSHNRSENTAVPCLVEPCADVDQIIIKQVSISSKKTIRDHITKQQFSRLYDLANGATPDDYLIQILIPADTTPMKLPVIEYPGIKEGADALADQRETHKTFQKNMLQTLAKYPGFLVACFQHKISIPFGHPMDIILTKYGEFLRGSNPNQKLPLIVSMQGESAVAGYCGNTNVEKDIQNDFASYHSFDTKIQLVNPCNLDYPVKFSTPGLHVEKWIKKLSRYKNVLEIQNLILKDGGIAWSRKLLEDVCKNSSIQEALDNLFLKPWIMESEDCYDLALECYNEIENYDEVAEIKEKIRKTILNETYRPLRYFFNHEMEYLRDNLIDNHREFWCNIFSQYYAQFIQDDQRCNAIASVLWDNIVKRVDADNKGFLGTREKDLPY
ncbi:MAG: hypothetical protein U9N77_10575, partial [Thermodesulfobacteriota bacterium]|nr:hypothetical protein [Thermodesulfobacteriota bacterium]